jgi:TrbL/VirB6 plasmid conjugal transfer protein
VLLGLMASWGDTLTDMVTDLNDQLGLNQTNVLSDYVQAVSTKFGVNVNGTGTAATNQNPQDQQQNPLSGFLNWAGKVASNTGKLFQTVALGADGLAGAFMGIFVLICSMLGMLAMWLMSGVQQILLWVCIGISPIFLGCLLIPPLGQLAARFFTNYVALTLWPLGWGIANLVTKALIDLAVNPSNSNGLGAFNFLGGGYVWWLGLGLWALFSSVAAPWLVTKALSAGENPMIALFGSAMGAATVVTQAGISVASMASAPSTGGASLAGGSVAASTLGPMRSFASRPTGNGTSPVGRT